MRINAKLGTNVTNTILSRSFVVIINGFDDKRNTSLHALAAQDTAPLAGRVVQAQARQEHDGNESKGLHVCTKMKKGKVRICSIF